MSHAMVIDDSRAVRMILCRTLSELGYEACGAADGVEALSLLRDDLSLILVDWNMPKMNGLDFLKHLRADKRFRNVRVIMVTTETEIAQMVKALEAGADEYVMKPFTRDAITDKLRLLGLLA